MRESRLKFGVVRGGVLRGLGGIADLVTGGAGNRAGELCDMRRFLILEHALALGTAVHATPLLPALRRAVPGCEIAMAASGFGREVFRHNPAIDRMIETVSPLRDVWGAVREMRSARVFGGETYAVLTPVGNERTKIATQAMASGPGARVGFTVAPAMFRVGLEFDFGLSQIANNLRIVGALGHGAGLPQTATEGASEPQVFFTEGELRRVQALLADGGVDAARPVSVLVTQTSVTQRKSWRAERFQAAARFLRERYGMQIVFAGAAGEARAIDELRGGLGFATLSVAGRTSITELAALLSVCDVGLTLDTGPMHLGRAVGLPMVIVAPAWSPVLEWLPVGDPRFVILKKLEMERAPDGYVIDEVSVEDVLGALVELLARYPPGERGSWPRMLVG